jgi:hypothetical protein
MELDLNFNLSERAQLSAGTQWSEGTQLTVNVVENELFTNHCKNET